MGQLLARFMIALGVMSLIVSAWIVLGYVIMWLGMLVRYIRSLF